MDLYQIRYFLKIVEIGSFTKAAEQLYVSQPSLSAGIKKLEKELGVSLFERGSRRIVVTPEGLLFQTRAQRILSEYQSIQQDFEILKGQPTLRIGMLHTLRSRNMAEIIGAFREENPSVSIEICNGYLQDLQNWLEKGEIDLALTWLPEQDDLETSQFLFYQPLMLAVPKDHAFANSKSIYLNTLHEQPYIRRINCEFWKAYPKIFESAGITPRVVYSSNNEEWVISLIQAGMGISIMPVWSNLEKVTYIPIVDLSLSRVIGLQWRGHQKRDVIEWFCHFIADYDWQLAS